MKKYFTYRLFTFTMLLLTAAMYCSCTDNEALNAGTDNENTDFDGKVQVAFAIPQSAASRLTAEEVQADNTFRGFEYVFFGFKLFDELDSPTLTGDSSLYIAQLSNGNFDALDVTENESGVISIIDVQLTRSSYDSVRYVMYCNSRYNEAINRSTLLPNVDGRFGYFSQLYEFGVMLHYCTAPALTSLANAIKEVFDEMDSVCTIAPLLNEVKDSLTTGSYELGNVKYKLNAISENGVENLLAYLAFQYEAAGLNISTSTTFPKLRKIVDIFSLSPGRYYASIKNAYKGLWGGYPKGCYFLKLGVSNGTNTAEFVTRTDNLYAASGDTLMRDAYCIPPGLWYYASGFMVERDTAYSINSWKSNGGIYNNVTLDDMADPRNTPSLAFSHSLQYGCGVAKTSVELDNTTISTSYYSNGSYTQGAALTIDDDQLICTGILFGNQYLLSDYKFDPKTHDNQSPLVTVYDTCMVNGVDTVAEGEVKINPVRGRMLKKGANNNICYTTLLPSREITASLPDDTIQIALELVNNTGRSLIGKNLEDQEVIAPGSTFYIMGNLIYSEATNAPPHNADRLFKADYTTNITLPLGDLTNANLYATVPEMQNLIATTALHVDVTWTAGDVYNFDMGKK